MSLLNCGLESACFRYIPAAAAGLLLLSASQAAQGGQFAFKSAGVMNANSCEAEVWHDNYADSLGAEVTCRRELPLSLKLEAGLPDNAADSYSLEGKYQLLEHESDGYALGVTATSTVESGSGKVARGAVVIPLSLELVPQRLNLHLNAGAVHDRIADSTDGYWGAALELGLAGPFTVIAETFATGSADPVLHTGVQAALLDGRLAFTVSYLDEPEPGGLDGWAAGAAFRLFTF